MAERILLVGMMGAGKSTVGHLVAARLGCTYSDSDAEVERRTGRGVADILRTDGEAAFRVLESEVLQDALAAVDGPGVVSVAGGAVLDPANRTLISRAGTVVWLRARLATLARRVGAGTGRPLLEGDPAANLERLYEVRRPFYEALAAAVVDVDALEPEEVADRVLVAAGIREAKRS